MQTTLDDYGSRTNRTEHGSQRRARIAIGLATISLLVAIALSSSIMVHAAPSAAGHAPHAAPMPAPVHGSLSSKSNRSDEEIATLIEDEPNSDPNVER